MLPPDGVDHVVVMGVSGVGKTTVARGLAELTGWDFAEGDDFHPASNVAAMAAGRPLTDDDRWAWLSGIGDWLSAEAAAGRSAVVSCSALRRAYRDLLREGRPSVRFCHLVAGDRAVADRLERRRDHYMPASLLPSQLLALEPLHADEPGVEVSVDGSPAAVLARVARRLGIDVPADPA